MVLILLEGEKPGPVTVSATSSRHFGGSAGRAESALHVDCDQRRFRRFQAIEPVQPPAPRDDPVDDLLPDVDAVHWAILP